ncbi:MAG TPA: class I SAM-dependent methyltransferase [Candidatus Eremiobacteraceae bacterium]|nr:class I SAM-dependent methyltransferase [Candidatus Eremiobacteraceae bacterium]
MNPVCRFCGAALSHVVVDLGLSPLSNALLTREQLAQPEHRFPLRPLVCERCWLVQLPEFAPPQAIFGDYVYFSSFSEAWKAHVAHYAARMMQLLELDERSLVVEVGSNDGQLLRCFAQRNIPVLGIEPAANVAAAAVASGIRTEVSFFGVQTATSLKGKYGAADLIVGNNVLAHVPDLNDFVAGLRELLKPGGTITMEFPHLLRLLEHTEFDTIYHEHFSYFSLSVVERVFAAHGLQVTNAEELPTHGGSLRIYAAHAGKSTRRSRAAQEIASQERAAGLETPAVYERFARDVVRAKKALLDFFAAAAAQGASVAGYGAPAKATTLLNYCGVDAMMLPYTVDRNPMKQGRFIPGVRIPIEQPATIAERQPAYLLLLPWNWAAEIIEQMAPIREWGGRFVVPIPKAAVLP